MKSIHVALLRGINVGGKHSLPMVDLRAMFETAGCRDVRTYIQSGNVVFAANGSLAARVPAMMARAIEERFEFAAPVVVRSAAELADVVRHNPFVEEGGGDSGLHVMFLATPPDASRVAALDPDLSPPDRFVVRGRDIYLACPNGIGRSKLNTQYFDSRLATTSTIRNWRTVQALLDMAGGE